MKILDSFTNVTEYISIAIDVVSWSRKSRKLYARAKKENDIELMEFIDSTNDIVEKGLWIAKNVTKGEK